VWGLIRFSVGGGVGVGGGGEGGRGAVYPCDEFGHIGRADNEQLGQGRGQNSIHGRKHVHLGLLNKRGKMKTTWAEQGEP
jgi:hypothetical protein